MAIIDNYITQCSESLRKTIPECIETLIIFGSLPVSTDLICFITDVNGNYYTQVVSTNASGDVEIDFRELKQGGDLPDGWLNRYNSMYQLFFVVGPYDPTIQVFTIDAVNYNSLSFNFTNNASSIVTYNINPPTP